MVVKVLLGFPAMILVRAQVYRAQGKMEGSSEVPLHMEDFLVEDPHMEDSLEVRVDSPEVFPHMEVHLHMVDFLEVFLHMVDSLGLEELHLHMGACLEAHCCMEVLVMEGWHHMGACKEFLGLEVSHLHMVAGSVGHCSMECLVMGVFHLHMEESRRHMGACSVEHKCMECLVMVVFRHCTGEQCGMECQECLE